MVSFPRGDGAAGGHDDRAEQRRAWVARAAVLLALAAYTAVALTVVLVGPDVVAGQIGPDGRPRRLDATLPFVVVLSIAVFGLVALFAALPRIVLRAPMAIINVPNREQWDSPAGRRMLARLLTSDMLLIAAATVLLLAAMLLISALGGFGVVLPGWVIVLVLAPYFVFVLGFAIAMYRGSRYVPPAGLTA